MKRPDRVNKAHFNFPEPNVTSSHCDIKVSQAALKTVKTAALSQGNSPTEQTEKKPRPRSCEVWEYLKQRPKNMVLCKLCNVEMT